mgnify:CR=1 FL=1
MCLDYHNEVKIALKFETLIHLTKKSFGFYLGFEPGSFRSQVAHLTPRPRGQ